MLSKTSPVRRTRLRSLILAMHIAILPQMAPAIGFDWHANGKTQSQNIVPQQALADARLALQQFQVIYGTSSWICSPAGFGQKSSCYAR